ncbi:MAG: Tol-Pal system beta propeller repeat protein TolB [Abyssibacter sp.]|nr:Tol-Pal system beta propeller repeat protein TolB [Abyssibacter sp.]MCK5859112.1 Tol-Pal system beta propeller repeat protein TolB [Abyssibacter sp.]
MKRFLLLTWLLLAAIPARADLNIVIDEGVSGALPIAVVPFKTSGQLPVDVTAVVAADLKRSGLFDPLPQDRMLAKPSRPEDVQLQNWRAADVDNLVVGEITQVEGGSYNIRFHLIDVYRGKQVIGYDVPATQNGLRSGAHRVADFVFQALTGQRGVFNTRIAYITANGQPGQRTFELIVADADGHDPRAVVRSGEPLMSPAWSPDRRKMAYVAFDDGESAIFIHELRSGVARELVRKPGINGAPAWSPDGSKIAAALSFGGDPEIYVMNVDGTGERRITNSSAIDTEPTWSPDGQKIAFTSDRGGQPQIYEVDLASGDTRRLTFEGRSNARAQYSPDGKNLILVNLDEQGYRIGVQELDTRQMRILSRGPLDESPSFAPNGRVIMYARQGGQLATATTDGRVRQTLSQQGTVREPAWSPYLN